MRIGCWWSGKSIKIRYLMRSSAGKGRGKQMLGQYLGLVRNSQKRKSELLSVR